MKLLITDMSLTNKRKLDPFVTHHASGVTSAELSTSGMAVPLSGIRLIAGVPMAGSAGFLRFISTAFSVGKFPEKSS